MRSMVSAFDSDSIRHAHKRSQMALKVPQLLLVDQVSFCEAIRDGGVDFHLQSAVMCLSINERDPVRRFFPL